jgi:hypothetical protein
VIEVVYYIRYDRRVKIGTSRRPRQRLASIRHEELLAFEPGGRDVEQARHREFADVREGANGSRSPRGSRITSPGYEPSMIPGSSMHAG